MSKTTIEAIVLETSNKIWNQKGKHTHNELDEIIRTALTTQKEEVVKEAIERLNKFSWGPYSPQDVLKEMLPPLQD